MTLKQIKVAKVAKFVSVSIPVKNKQKLFRKRSSTDEKTPTSASKQINQNTRHLLRVHLVVVKLD